MKNFVIGLVVGCILVLGLKLVAFDVKAFPDTYYIERNTRIIMKVLELKYPKQYRKSAMTYCK